MKISRVDQIYNLLKGIETGDPESVKVVDEVKYIQHNPQTEEGGEGLAELFKRLSKTNPKVEIKRIFSDGDFVFAHTIYDFSSVNIGFEVFRFEGDKVVEHWDNIQTRVGDMISGTTIATDNDLTESNRLIIKRFINEVAIEENYNSFLQFLDPNSYIEHSSFMNIREKLEKVNYKINHRLLAQGSFVLSVNEGEYNSDKTSFYDLFRIENGKIVEHWDTIEKVPHKNEWKNTNGKF